MEALSDEESKEQPRSAMTADVNPATLSCVNMKKGQKYEAVNPMGNATTV